LSGDEIQRNKVPETGQMYVFDLFLLLAGIVAFVKKPKGKEIVIWWLIIAPVSAALTFQSPHALRAQNMLVPLTIISAYGLAFLENWAEHYHGEFLFLSGDEIQRNKVPETGQMYVFDFFLLVAGIVAFVKKPKGKEIVIWWLIVAPVASALTFQSPHALRAQNMIIPLVIISAFGLIVVLNWLDKNIKSNRLRATCYLLLATLIGWNFARYQHMYWIHMAQEYPFSSQYGVKELVDYVGKNEQKYEKVIISDKYDQPYILFLFYSKYSPKKFQESHELTARDKFGFSTVRSFDKYEFRSTDFNVDKTDNFRNLIIGADGEIPDEADIVKEIYGINGYKYFQIVAN
jgi:fumarate reductase subunit D